MLYYSWMFIIHKKIGILTQECSQLGRKVMSIKRCWQKGNQNCLITEQNNESVLQGTEHMQLKQVLHSQFNDWSFGRKRSARSIAFAIPAKRKWCEPQKIGKLQDFTSNPSRDLLWGSHVNSTYEYTSREWQCCEHEKIMKHCPIFSNQIIQLISNYDPNKMEELQYT